MPTNSPGDASMDETKRWALAGWLKLICEIDSEFGSFHSEEKFLDRVLADIRGPLPDWLLDELKEDISRRVKGDAHA